MDSKAKMPHEEFDGEMIFFKVTRTQPENTEKAPETE